MEWKLRTSKGRVFQIVQAASENFVALQSECWSIADI